jgi:hypothetical protein
MQKTKQNKTNTKSSVTCKEEVLEKLRLSWPIYVLGLKRTRFCKDEKYINQHVRKSCFIIINVVLCL